MFYPVGVSARWGLMLLKKPTFQNFVGPVTFGLYQTGTSDHFQYRDPLLFVEIGAKFVDYFLQEFDLYCFDVYELDLA